MSNLDKYGIGNQPPSIKTDSRPVYMEQLNHLVGKINELANVIANNLSNKVDKEEGKELSQENFTTLLKTLYEDNLDNNNVLEERVPPRLLPQSAFVEIPYSEVDNITITAVSTNVDGEEIIVEFVDPEDVSQAISVSYDSETNTVIISHATDVNGDISTLAGNLVTAINTDEVVGLIIQASMDEAGTVDFVGIENLDNWIPGIECKKNYLFVIDTGLALAVNDCNGVDNVIEDFKFINFTS
jgi:hypothetical protein